MGYNFKPSLPFKPSTTAGISIATFNPIITNLKKSSKALAIGLGIAMVLKSQNRQHSDILKISSSNQLR
ncbi:hypothetical protein Glove_441g35 [Diversispora epigaea]|uniref:Uncharacterized protein n=1 Tax=Diversispora epigaea TaxID=1348612 RepID=A0A397GR74_9GLOM|nr:hypothetical protein Glove_441g35 [Diversispora epigaea]